jgi:flagellar biosynthesis protein FlhG
MRDQAEKLRQLARNALAQNINNKQQTLSTQAKVIAVTSGKGGVGKTNFTVNLSLALADLGKNVLIIDADLGLANVEFVLGCSPTHSLFNLLDGGCKLSDVITNGPRGIKFLSGGSGIHQMANLSEAHLNKIVSQIVMFDEWADIILIDTGAGLHRNVLNFVMAADEVIIVTTPEPTAIADAYAMMKAYSTHCGKAPLRLVVNRVTEDEEGQLVVAKLVNVSSRFLSLDIDNLGFVYEDRNVVKAVKSQIPVLLAHPDTIAARCFEHIAQRLIFGKDSFKTNGIKGFFNKFLNIIR